MPDLSSYNIPKWGKIYQNAIKYIQPKCNKIYPMAIKYTM
jgi:hypothetical protein